MSRVVDGDKRAGVGWGGGGVTAVDGVEGGRGGEGFFASVSFSPLATLETPYK